MIYFLSPTDGGPVKIGYSDDVEARRRQLEAHYGKPLAVLATMPGGMEEERAIHERFAALRLGRTEQFRPAAELLAFIGRPLLVGVNPDAVEAMAPRGFDPERQDVSVKFDKTLAGKARLIAQGRGVALAEYLTEMCRPQIDRDYGKLMRELEAGE